MYRFTMPDTGLSLSEQADAIRLQLDQFEGSDALRGLLELVGADRYTIREMRSGYACATTAEHSILRNGTSSTTRMTPYRISASRSF
jgi:hypothetical protein